jgi:hypothetical protein
MAASRIRSKTFMDDLNEIENGQLCQETIQALSRTVGGLKYFPGLLKKIIVNKSWQCRVNMGTTIELGSLRELVTEFPIRGWGEDPKKIEAVIKDDPEVLAMFREAMKQQGNNQYTKSKGDNVPRAKRAERSNARAYSVTRVQQECKPEVFAKVMAGEMSPNAALVKAGIRENRQVYLPRDPKKAWRKLREHFGAEFMQAMVAHETERSPNVHAES